MARSSRTTGCHELPDTGFDRRRAARSSPAGRGRAGPDEDLGEIERASTGRTAITAAVLEEDVASSRRAGAAAEIHDALTSGATAAVTLVREDLVEFEPGRVARWTGRGCAGATYATRCARR